MNKRDFLRGCAATLVGAVAAGKGLIEAPRAAMGLYGRSPLMDALPDMQEINAWHAQWLKDVMPIYGEAINDMVMFGTSGIEQIEEYPYIKAIDITTLHYAPDPIREAEKRQMLGRV